MEKRSNKANKSAVITTNDAILESISDGVFTVDAEWRVTSYNHAAEKITGIFRKEAIGRPARVFRSSMCETGCALGQTLKTGMPVIGRSAYIIRADGARIPISVSTSVLRDARGRIAGGAETFRDLSEVETLRRELEGRYHVGDLASRSPLMQQVFEVLPAIAVSPSTVLVLGETGTGKELMTQQAAGLFAASIVRRQLPKEWLWRGTWRVRKRSTFSRQKGRPFPRLRSSVRRRI
jgi:PAS domain S-box-containing protein